MLLRKLRKANAGEATLEHPILESACAQDGFPRAVSMGTSGCKVPPGAGVVPPAAAVTAAVRAAMAGDVVHAGTDRFSSTGEIGCRTSIGEVCCRIIVGFNGLTGRGKVGDVGVAATRETSR